jgi:hypothetical protein
VPTTVELVEQVRSRIRDKNDPTIFARATTVEPVAPDELEAFVADAVHDYSRWKPLENKRGTLSIETGKVEYPLPADFIVANEFLLGHRVSGKMAYLVDEPAQSFTFTFWYCALHTAETVPDQDVPALVSFAAANALRAIVAEPKKLDQYVSYDLKDVIRVDAENTTEIGKEIIKTADAWEKQYMTRVTSSSAAAPKPYVSFG